MKSPSLILTITILALSCKDSNKPVPTAETQITNQDSLKTKENSKKQLPFGLILERESLKLYGDTTIDKDKIHSAYIKFEPYISFNDFKVNSVDHKKYADLDLQSNKSANRFRTRLSIDYDADTANFGGHYTFAYWGCGSPCQSSMLIDRKTGKVYDSPEASLGYEFRVDNRMLIVNPPDSSGYYEELCLYCKPEIYIFDERTKTFTKREGRNDKQY